MTYEGGVQTPPTSGRRAFFFKEETMDLLLKESTILPNGTQSGSPSTSRQASMMEQNLVEVLPSLHERTVEAVPTREQAFPPLGIVAPKRLKVMRGRMSDMFANGNQRYETYEGGVQTPPISGRRAFLLRAEAFLALTIRSKVTQAGSPSTSEQASIIEQNFVDVFPSLQERTVDAVPVREQALPPLGMVAPERLKYNRYFSIKMTIDETKPTHEGGVQTPPTSGKRAGAARAVDANRIAAAKRMIIMLLGRRLS